MTQTRPADDTLPVYSAAGNHLARMMYWAGLGIAVLGGLGGASAVVTGGVKATPYAVLAAAFAVGCLAVRRFYGVEPVWASAVGLWVQRDGRRIAIPWPRVGGPRPMLGLEGPIVVVVVSIEGERRPVRFVAGRGHRDVLRRERERASKADATRSAAPGPTNLGNDP